MKGIAGFINKVFGGRSDMRGLRCTDDGFQQVTLVDENGNAIEIGNNSNSNSIPVLTQVNLTADLTDQYTKGDPIMLDGQKNFALFLSIGNSTGTMPKLKLALSTDAVRWQLVDLELTGVNDTLQSIVVLNQPVFFVRWVLTAVSDPLDFVNITLRAW